MPEENQDLERMALEGMDKRVQGQLALQYVGKKDYGSAAAALEILTEKEVGSLAKGLLEGTKASQKGIETAARIYGKEYQEEMGKLTLEGYYQSCNANGYNEGLGEDTVQSIERLLQNYGDKTYGSIMKEAARAEYILKGGNVYEFSDEQKEAAQKTLEKYGNLIQIINMYEDVKMSKLEPGVRKRVIKKKSEEIGEAAKEQADAEAV